MKKKPVATKRVGVANMKPAPDGLTPLIAEVRSLILSTRRGVASVVDTFQVMTNFEIGRRIVEHKQKGEKRAAYGAELLKELSARLTQEFGQGFSERNLEYMRKFYLLWQNRAVAISQTPSAKLGTIPFTLSWSHYVELLGIKDPDERSFYEIESVNSDWNVRELRRQKASILYQRLALSRDKAGIRKFAKEGQAITKPEDLFKEPLVLEFLGLDERARYSESDLESAIITQEARRA